MWLNNFKKISKEFESYNKKVNKGASPIEVDCFVKKSMLSIPNEYIETLKKFNGIEFNGFILYGIDERYLTGTINQKIYGLYELNQIYHQENHNLQSLFLGESNISFYVYAPNKNIYLELDNPSGSIIQSFETLDCLLNKFFSEAIL